jgi:hypothetical protein
VAIFIKKVVIQIKENEFFKELFPALRYIFFVSLKKREKRMPLRSGLGHSFSKKYRTQKNNTEK